MKNKKILKLVELIFLLCIVVLLFRGSKNDKKFYLQLNVDQQKYIDNHFKNIESIKKQKNKKRIIKTNLIIEKRINLNDEFYLYKICFFKIYKDNIYINDYASSQIYKFPIDSILNKEVFGNGIGKGPGEYLNVTDMAFDDDKIFICSDDKNSVEIYSIKGDFIRSLTFKNSRPRRIFTNRKNNKLIISDQSDRISYYKIYDYQGNFIKEFGGALVNNKLNSIFYHEQKMTRMSDASFLQVPNRLGIVGFYNSGNELQYIKETIDGQQNPDILGNIGSERFNFKNNFLPSDKVASNNNLIILLSRRIKNEVYDDIYDVYDKDSFDYLYSFKLNLDKNDRLYDFRIYKNLFIGLNSKFELIFWKLPN